ncbi:hypothetical protein OO013_03745 [Mangrovivirga sp. M17]|uniref:Cytochrome B n=1 Tax=Mangrovivirga halotolerans TaxID=2993936 RepID=A0ABT3RNN7_9BACT|nr:hypothetical protein [Mangrovivirga halotolerans]MCX2742963.1 hypothetical protein [Mangrovivirga halotolerans]
MFDTFILFVHSWVRWIILILAIITIFMGLTGMSGNKTFGKAQNAMSAAFLGSMHLQLLTGLILYLFISPVGYQAFQSDANVMKEASLRYWAVEHITVMIIAIAVAQIGRVKIKKATEEKAKYKNMLIFNLIALILVLSRIPWDQAGRMFRGL